MENIYASLKSDGKLVIEMSGQNNSQTILNALKTSLINHGCIENSEKQVIFFPSVRNILHYWKNRFYCTLVLYFGKNTELTGKDGLKTFLTMFYSPFFENY